MLLSPGHSPRVISSPSPSLANSENNPTTSSLIAPSSNPRNHRNRVLDEDSYVAAIEKIIERDFFPDISKLRDRLDWLEALKSRDPLLIRDAQLKIIERRRGNGLARRPGNNDSDRRTQTPGSTFVRSFTPFDEFDTKTPNPDGARVSFPEEDVGDGAAAIDPSLSLDEFFRRYTSEDNESFSKILEKVNRKRKERCGHLLKGEEDEEVKTIEDVKRDRITDGYGTSDQPPSTLDSWKFTAKNLLMYHPADRGEAPLTIEERAVRLKSLEKEISRTNTRFHGTHGPPPPDSSSGETPEVSALYAPLAGATPVLAMRDRDKSKKYDLDDLRKTPDPSRSDGYSFVRTPSPAPGVEGSPFVTWGEIDGTPLRLDFEDDDISDGPRYKIPCPATRDEKAHSLSREAARKLRERSRMFRKPPLPSSPAPPSASPRAALSPAAQKFVRNAIMARSSVGPGGGVDETLRASYRGSSPATTTTPRRGSGRSVSRLGRESRGGASSRSPSVGEGSNLPW